METTVKSETPKPYIRPQLVKRDTLSLVSGLTVITSVKPD